MSTTLLLIRHGETEWNVLGKFQGCQNIDLSAKGVQQAHLLSKRLQGHFDAVYSSPLSRAFMTADILCSHNQLAPIPLKDLTEIHFGSWEGLTYEEIKTNYPEHFVKWRTDEEVGPMYDGELSIQNASLRAKNCILDLISRHKDETIVIVSHGGFIKAALIGLFSWRMTMYHQLAVGNTCITKIKFNDKLNPILLGFNDTTHLVSETAYSV